MEENLHQTVQIIKVVFPWSEPAPRKSRHLVPQPRALQPKRYSLYPKMIVVPQNFMS